MNYLCIALYCLVVGLETLENKVCVVVALETLENKVCIAIVTRALR